MSSEQVTLAKIQETLAIIVTQLNELRRAPEDKIAENAVFNDMIKASVTAAVSAALEASKKPKKAVNIVVGEADDTTETKATKTTKSKEKKQPDLQKAIALLGESPTSTNMVSVLQQVIELKSWEDLPDNIRDAFREKIPDAAKLPTSSTELKKLAGEISVVLGCDGRKKEASTKRSDIAKQLADAIKEEVLEPEPEPVSGQQ